MNTTKTLLAASILAAAGAANATIIDTYTVAVKGVTSILASGSLVGTGTATLDDSGVLTVDYTSLNTQPAAIPAGSPAGTVGTFYTVVEAVYKGTISGTTFTNSTDPAVVSTLTILSCSDGDIACPSSTPVGVVDPLEVFVSGATATAQGGGLLIQAFNTAGGGTNSTAIRSLGTLVNKVTYTFSAATPVTPAVPVPAAAWLFGSGLLGLAGTARRRRNA